MISTNALKPWDGASNNVSINSHNDQLFLVDDFILELDPNHDGEITEEEFMLVMKYIQQRTSTQFPPLGQSQSMSSAEGSQASH